MPALHGYHGTSFKFSPVVINNFRNDFNTPGRTNVGQADESGVGNPVQVNQFSEIFVYRDEDPVIRFSQYKQGPVAGVRSESLSFKRVMPVIAKPIGQTAPGTPIDQKSHDSATETVARVSLAMTA